MPDREKVISHIAAEIENAKFWKKHYALVGVDMLSDAIALLKEKEAVTIKKTKEHGFGVYGGICPKCMNWIQSAHSYCGFCGQAVNWE